jgi:hypothetical protein
VPVKKIGSFQKAVKAFHAGWFLMTVEKALMDRGKTFVGLLITEKVTGLNDTMKTNEESTNGEFHVDFGKFFKKQATNLDVTIYEETKCRLEDIKQK